MEVAVCEGSIKGFVWGKTKRTSRFREVFLISGKSVEELDALLVVQHVDRNVKIVQLVQIDFARALVHRARGTRVLRERDEVTDGFFTFHGCDNAVETEGKTTVRRSAVLEGIDEEAELFLHLFFGETEETENLFLNFRVVNTDRTTTDFDTVQDEVVCFGVAILEVAVEHHLEMFWERVRERVVHRHVAAFRFAVFEHREFGNPHEFALLRIAETLDTGDFQAELAHSGCCNLFRTCDEEHHVAALGTDSVTEFVQLFRCEELADLSFDFVIFLDAHPNEALGTVLADISGEFVNLLTGEVHATLGCDTADLSASCDAVLEHAEVGLGADFGNIVDFEIEAKVRLVGTVLEHGFVPLHATDMLRRFEVPNLAENVRDELVEHFHDFVLVDERHFDVDLGEFRLTVCAKVFVAEALGDLEVAVHAGNHQKLLVLLRRLREGVELARVHTGRHEVVTCAFRSGLAKARSFNVFKTVCIEKVVHGLEETALEEELLLNPRTAKIQVTVLQAKVVVFLAFFVRVVDGERRSEGGVQNFKLICLDFNFTGSELVVGIAFFTGIYLTSHVNDVFITELFRCLQNFGIVIRVENDLRFAKLVAEVNEDDSTVVAAAIHPTGECYSLANIFLAKLAAVMCAFHKVNFLDWEY